MIFRNDEFSHKRIQFFRRHTIWWKPLNLAGSAMFIFSVGVLLVVLGFAFLGLSLLSAIREVYPSREYSEQLKRSPDTQAYVALLAEVGKLKTWLALSVVGSLLVFAGAYTADPPNLSGILSRVGGHSAGNAPGPR